MPSSWHRWTAAFAMPKWFEEYQGQHTRHALGQGRSRRPILSLVPRATTTRLTRTTRLSPTFAQKVPMLCAECHRAGDQAAVRIQSDVRRHRAELCRQHPRQGPAGERSGRHGHLCRLPHRPRRAAARRRALYGPSRQRSRDLLEVPSGYRRDLQDQHPLAGEQRHRTELPTCNTCHSSHTISRSDLRTFGFR